VRVTNVGCDQQIDFKFRGKMAVLINLTSSEVFRWLLLTPRFK